MWVWYTCLGGETCNVLPQALMCMVLFPSSKLAIAVFTATTLERSHVEAVIGKKQTFALLDLLRPVYTPSIPRLFPPNLSLIWFFFFFAQCLEVLFEKYEKLQTVPESVTGFMCNTRHVHV